MHAPANEPKPKPISLHEFKKRRRPLRNINVEMHEKRTRLDKLALWITSHVGTMGFFLVIFAWTVFWLSWNLLAPERLQFDPPMGFVFWLFLSNLIQILLMPLIMVGQNIIGRHAEARAEHDLEINKGRAGDRGYSPPPRAPKRDSHLDAAKVGGGCAGNAGEREGLSRSSGRHAALHIEDKR